MKTQRTSEGCTGRGLSFVVALLALLATTLASWTQYPPMPLTGPTMGANLRNMAAATQNQAGIVRRTANDWGRRVNSGAYRQEYFQQDFANLQAQFQLLREQFNGLGSLALQTGRPRADNAVAELDAGLNMISELFTFLVDQFNAGTLDRNTIVRTCRAFEDAMREWERELKKNSSRLGLAY
jgi:hypothetical protein